MQRLLAMILGLVPELVILLVALVVGFIVYLAMRWTKGKRFVVVPPVILVLLIFGALAAHGGSKTPAAAVERSLPDEGAAIIRGTFHIVSVRSEPSGTMVSFTVQREAGARFGAGIWRGDALVQQGFGAHWHVREIGETHADPAR